jgi:type III secretion system low calcium response chaperone LcrH/SycD
MEKKEIDNQETVEFIRHFAEDVMKQLPKGIPEEEKGKYVDLMIEIFVKNRAAKDAMGFSDEMIENIYAYGHRLYNNGNYKKAKEVFTALTVFLPNEPRFYLGKAACCQSLHEWEEAATGYYTCGDIDKDSPMPYYYLYECLSQLKRFHEAAAALGEVIARCGDLDIFIKIKERCVLLLQNIPPEVRQAPTNASEQAIVEELFAQEPVEEKHEIK